MMSENWAVTCEASDPVILAILLSMVGELVTRPSIGLPHDDWGIRQRGG